MQNQYIALPTVRLTYFFKRQLKKTKTLAQTETDFMEGFSD